MSDAEARALQYIRRGYSPAEIATELGVKLSVARNLCCHVLDKLGVGRIQLILEHLDEERTTWQLDLVKVAEYRKAAEVIAGCTHNEQVILAEFLRQWQVYIKCRDGDAPTRESVMATLHYQLSTIGTCIKRIATKWGRPHAALYQLLRLYCMARAYYEVFGEISIPDAPEELAAKALIAQVYELTRQGWSRNEIARFLGLDPDTVRNILQKVYRLTDGKPRIELMLEDVEEHCPDDTLPPEAYAMAEHLICNFTTGVQRRLLETALSQWQAYRSQRTQQRDAPPPSYASYMEQLGIGKEAVKKRINRMCTALGITQHHQSSLPVLIRLYYMATLWPIIQLETKS